jgi:hypothetical protein
MNKITLKKIVLLCVALLSLAVNATSETYNDIPSLWNIEVEAKDVISAAKQICLMYQGNGYWEKADIQTMGVHVLSQSEEASKITLCLYTSHGVFDVSSAAPNNLAGGYIPVRIVLNHVDNKYLLDSYQEPEDGSDYYESMRAIFGKEMANDIAKNQFDYGNQADQDALNEVHHYMSGESGTWIEFLDTGSNPLAEDIVTKSLPGEYPSFEGKTISVLYKRIYALTIEGEKSYSGTLTYQSFDIAGNQLSSVKLRVVGNEIKILDGEMPPLYE